MTSSAASALTVKYDVFVDNGDGSFNAAEDLKVNYRTVTGQSISNTATYSVSMLDYAPYSKDYAFINRNLWINAAATTSLGNQFTRLYKISNTCQTTNPIPAPTVNPDYFVLGMDGWEGNTSLKAHVYGNNTKWSNDPMAADYQVSSLSTSPALNSGTDGDNTDAPLSAMKFIFSGLQLENGPACQSATPNLGTLVVNEKGFFEYTIGDLCVNVVSFTYTVQNNLSGLSSAPIKVTIQIANPIILPVSYKSFSATRSSNSQVILEWETAMEENNRGFHVQRNTDGSWKNIGFVFSAAQGGNSSEVLKYAFKDANGSKGITQYRILQVDMDGKGKYSEVRAVRGLETAAARVTLFPNPSSTGTFNLMFEDGSSLRDVVVSDVSGRVVKQYKAVSGNTLTVDGLTDGFYTVQVANRNSGTTSIEKVIIKKR
ncbi:MAG: T9SS type A sorting domain-containing protein [Chitinophagaceae bacterium]